MKCAGKDFTEECQKPSKTPGKCINLEEIMLKALKPKSLTTLLYAPVASSTIKGVPPPKTMVDMFDNFKQMYPQMEIFPK